MEHALTRVAADLLAVARAARRRLAVDLAAAGCSPEAIAMILAHAAAEEAAILARAFDEAATTVRTRIGYATH